MKLSRECASILLLAAIPATLCLWFHPRRPVLTWNQPRVGEINLDEIVHSSSAVLWVDARTADEYQKRHIPQAILLNEESWEQLLPGFLEAWHPGTKVIVYCDSRACDASQGVALRIKNELSLTEIYVLRGGWHSWLITSH